MNTRRKIFLVLSIVWMVVIFMFSSRDADDSEKTSHEVGMVIGEIVVPDFEELPVVEKEAWAEGIDFYVRKSAHALEYALLAILVSGWLIDDVRDKKRFMRLLGALGVAAMYACTDEFHQLFVKGRAGRIMDVLIDSAGATAGLIIVCVFMQLYIAFSKKKQRKIY